MDIFIGNITVKQGFPPGNNFCKGGLPHAGWPEQGIESGVFHGKGKIIDDGNLAARVSELQIMTFKTHAWLQDIFRSKLPKLTGLFLKNQYPEPFNPYQSSNNNTGSENVFPSRRAPSARILSS